MEFWTREAVEVLGYGGVFLVMLIEDIVVPLPSEVIMPAAGFLAQRAGLSLWGVVAAGTAGSLVGGLPWFYLGRALAGGYAPRWFVRQVEAHRGAVDLAHVWFAAHGGGAVILARLLPGVRALIGIPAAFAGMSLTNFLAASAAGTVVWVGGLAALGSLLGTDAQVIGRVLGVAWGFVVVGGLGAVIFVLWRRHVRRLSYRPRTRTPSST